jgi:DNA-binding CsgD family transcriptional regulator
MLIVSLLARGKTPKEVARCLGISRDTVYEGIEDARKRLGARTTCELIAVVTRLGVLAD